MQIFCVYTQLIPDGLVVRIRRSHRRGRGSIPRQGASHFFFNNSLFEQNVFKSPFKVRDLHEYVHVYDIFS